MSVLNERLRECRNSCGFTLLEVAEIVGVSEATMQRYESGEIKNIKHSTIVTLANKYGVEPAYLMGWESNDITEYVKTRVNQEVEEMSTIVTNARKTKKAAQGEMTLNGFDHALLDLTKEYTPEQKAQFLENAKIFDNSLKWKEQHGDE